MKCFNHTEREAVATCQKCGKGLCRECAEKYTPCMCDPCAAHVQQNKQEQAQNRENQRKEKYRTALVDTRGEFIKTTVIGILVSVIATWWTANNGNLSNFGDYANAIVAWFFVPFGWKFLTYLQSFFPVSLFGTFWFWIIYIAVKAVLSVIVGIPAFIYQLVKTVLAQRKINKLK
ncbi:MAG: hypothetical protein J1F22_01315 [Lachnospiraceae bacterium]|nr:hypothetical protein [Lachnospiraceae bacterium]